MASNHQYFRFKGEGVYQFLNTLTIYNSWLLELVSNQQNFCFRGRGVYQFLNPATLIFGVVTGNLTHAPSRERRESWTLDDNDAYLALGGTCTQEPAAMMHHGYTVSNSAMLAPTKALILADKEGVEPSRLSARD